MRRDDRAFVSYKVGGDVNTAKARTVPQQRTPPPMLNFVNFVDAPFPSTVHVCSDDIEDVAADATTKKAGSMSALLPILLW
jgi:hypothetical protein